MDRNGVAAARSVLSNYKGLGEGVDIPNVDSVAILDPKGARHDPVHPRRASSHRRARGERVRGPPGGRIFPERVFTEGRGLSVAKRATRTVPVSARRVREGWHGPADTRIRLAAPGEVGRGRVARRGA